MKLFFSLFLIFITISYGEINNSDINKTDKNISVNSKVTIYEKKITELREELSKLKKSKELNNEWTKTYSSYIAHKGLIDRKKLLDKQIEKLNYIYNLTQQQKKALTQLKKESKILEDKINLTKNFEDNPFKKLIAPPILSKAPKITNPFALISGLSFIKELSSKKNKYQDKYKELENTITSLYKQKYILNKIANLSNSQIDKEHLKYLDNEIKKLLTIKDIFKTTKELYLKKSDELKIAIETDIKKEFEKIAYIGIIFFIFLSIFIFLKYLIQKYLSNRESFYTINKIINITFISILLITLLFAYLENVSYLITILGFASAGIAIALKDWFMSIMGWFVIVIGGSVHVGDRVKFVRGNTEYVGDVIDISLLRMTIQEEITLTTYTHNRRAGRVIFIPNNYVFTDMIANYSHAGLKTVWDGIDFYITFESNISKTMTLAKAIAKQYSKGYTDLRRKQINKLRSKYQLKNTNVEPKVYSFIEGYGIKISVWYLTNSYATLTLRSTISAKIIEEILNTEDIKLAYPTQSFYVNKNIPTPKIKEEE